MTIPIPVLGLASLAIALVIALFAPPGRRGGWALIMSLVVFSLFLVAAYSLWPVDPRNGWNWVLPGAIGGAIAVLILDIRRWARYFTNLTYRMRHPYYWYSRLYPRRRRRY